MSTIKLGLGFPRPSFIQQKCWATKSDVRCKTNETKLRVIYHKSQLMVKSWQIMEKLLPIKGESPLSAADVNLGCCLPFTLLLQMCGELEMKRVWHFIIIFLCLLFSFKEKREKMCIFLMGDKIA